MKSYKKNIIKKKIILLILVFAFIFNERRDIKYLTNSMFPE